MREKVKNNQRIDDRAIKKAQRQDRNWSQRLALPLILVGALLFLGGQIGARTGLTFLPFDKHHFAQFIGAAVAFRGLMWLR